MNAVFLMLSFFILHMIAYMIKPFPADAIVRIHFSKTSSETMSDKIMRMLKNEIRQM